MAKLRKLWDVHVCSRRWLVSTLREHDLTLDEAKNLLTPHAQDQIQIKQKSTYFNLHGKKSTSIFKDLSLQNESSIIGKAEDKS